MTDLLSFTLLSFTSFFTLINPLGTMPIFMSMTADNTISERNSIARKALLTAFITMILFALSGQVLFNFFGISANAFRIVGGVIFFMMGYDMLQARMAKTKMRDENNVDLGTNEDISVTPLGIPIICGPGAITNAIVLMEDADTWMKVGALFSSIAVVTLITLITLMSSTYIMKILGRTGTRVMTRLMGLITMVIAVEFFFSGLRPMVKSMLAG